MAECSEVSIQMLPHFLLVCCKLLVTCKLIVGWILNFKLELSSCIENQHVKYSKNQLPFILAWACPFRYKKGLWAVFDLDLFINSSYFSLLMKTNDRKRFSFIWVFTSVNIFMWITKNQQVHCIHYHLLKKLWFLHWYCIFVIFLDKVKNYSLV